MKEKNPEVFVEVLSYRQRFMEVYRSTVDKLYMYFYFHHKYYDSAVEGKGLITRFNLLRSSGKKGRGNMDKVGGNMDTFQETSSTQGSIFGSNIAKIFE